MFTIDADYNITAHVANAVFAPCDGITAFDSEKEFAAATAAWPLAKYVSLWNTFAGTPGFDTLRTLTKFMDRGTAVKRIWRAIRNMPAVATPVEPEPAAAPAEPEPAPAAIDATITAEGEDMPKATPKKKARKTAKTTAKAATKAAVSAPAADVAPEKGTRKETVLALIGRKHGATLAEIMDATGWQKHSVRGFISTLGSKHGLSISSTKNEAGERVYQHV